MLSQLTIKNFGLIDQVELDFQSGLNILTGETGAGKSILIEALRVALGGRMTPTHVRDANHQSIIEAIFDLSGSQGINWDGLREYFSDNEPEIIIQRVYKADGRGKIKVNGLSVTATQLKAIGRLLVDFHGAHDHQMLLASECHMGMLDRLIDFGTSWTTYQKQYSQFDQLNKKLKELENLSQSRERELDMLKHQVVELEQVPLVTKDYDQLKSDLAKVDNMERLNESLKLIMDILDSSQYGISRKTQELFSPMRALNAIDESTEEFMSQLNDLQAQSDDLLAQINDYANTMSFNESDAYDIHKKRDIYDDILRKYGPTIEAAEEFYEKAKERLNILDHLDENDTKLRADIDKLQKAIIKTAKDITSSRKKAAKLLKKTIEKELSELGIANVEFECRVEKGSLSETGIDEVTFYISPNAGFDLKPLAEIVSSGEAARVMLALKKALIKVDPIPVLIFDEIDAQIGGRLGTITGEKLRDISNERQVILITHLPQIASFADAHFKVVKSVKSKKTITDVIQLTAKERINEVAQMMSGKDQSDISLKHAKDLISNASRG